MDERLAQYNEKMQKSLDNLLAEFGGIRAGRANPHVLDKIKVDYYGTPTALQQVANINVPEPRMIPELTEERRKEIAKDIKKKGESAKVAVRNIRRDANDAFKKLSKSADISEDEIKELEDGVQKLTDKYIAQIDKAVDEKNKEILTV